MFTLIIKKVEDKVMDFNQNQQQEQSPYKDQYSNQNDAYSNHRNTNYKVPITKPANSLAVAAMSLSIIALILAFTCTIYPTLVLGGLAIILALLSKGYDTKMHAYSLTGIIIASASIFLNIVIIASVLVLLFSPYANPEYRKEFDSLYEKIYGESFDDSLQNITEGL